MHERKTKKQGTPNIGDDISKEFLLGLIVATALLGLAIKICVRLLS